MGEKELNRKVAKGAKVIWDNKNRLKDLSFLRFAVIA